MNENLKNVCEMTKEDFAKLPRFEDGNVDNFDPMKDSFESLVIIPTEETHESGYRCMEFALIDNEGNGICRIHGFSDAINIGGIGGYGVNGILNARRDCSGRRVVVPHGWCIDCLPCGYLRLFTGGNLILERPYLPLSNFEIYAEEKEQ